MESATLSPLATLLRDLRKDEPIMAVVSKIKCARSYLYQLEKGERTPGAPILGKLLDAYGATPKQRATAWDLLAKSAKSA